MKWIRCGENKKRPQKEVEGNFRSFMTPWIEKLKGSSDPTPTLMDKQAGVHSSEMICCKPTQGLPRQLTGKESTSQAGDSGFNLCVRTIPWRIQYSCLKNPMGRGAWWATIHGVTESVMTQQLNNKPILKTPELGLSNDNTEHSTLSLCTTPLHIRTAKERPQDSLKSMNA